MKNTALFRRRMVWCLVYQSKRRPDGRPLLL